MASVGYNQLYNVFNQSFVAVYANQSNPVICIYAVVYFFGWACCGGWVD